MPSTTSTPLTRPRQMFIKLHRQKTKVINNVLFFIVSTMLSRTHNHLANHFLGRSNARVCPFRYLCKIKLWRPHTDLCRIRYGATVRNFWRAEPQCLLRSIHLHNSTTKILLYCWRCHDTHISYVLNKITGPFRDMCVP